MQKSSDFVVVMVLVYIRTKLVYNCIRRQIGDAQSISYDVYGEVIQRKVLKSQGHIMVTMTMI